MGGYALMIDFTDAQILEWIDDSLGKAQFHVMTKTGYVRVLDYGHHPSHVSLVSWVRKQMQTEAH